MSPTPTKLIVNTTTGGSFDVNIDSRANIDHLRAVIASKLKLGKDRIRLLHRERELQNGNLNDYNIVDGAKIFVVPNLEAGLLVSGTQRPESNVLQAVESLNDASIQDFLQAKGPLNLTLRLGDHTVTIQLQLSPFPPPSLSGGGASNDGVSDGAGTTGQSDSTTATNSTAESGTSRPSSSSSRRHYHRSRHSSSNSHNSKNPLQRSPLDTAGATLATNQAAHGADRQKRAKSRPNHISNSLDTVGPGNPMTAPVPENEGMEVSKANTSHQSWPTRTYLEQSPIKSLSNLVSNRHIQAPMASTEDNVVNIDPSQNKSSSCCTDTTIDRNADDSITLLTAPECGCYAQHGDAAATKFTSCLCKRLNASVENHSMTLPLSPPTSLSPSSSSSSSSSLYESQSQSSSQVSMHRTLHNPIGRTKPPKLSSSAIRSYSGSAGDSAHSGGNNSSQSSNSNDDPSVNSNIDLNLDESYELAEASRTLAKTLQKMFSSKLDFSVYDNATAAAPAATTAMAPSRGRSYNAAMSQGIFSGTFSSTVNSVRQEAGGRQKRGRSMVVHILNDLLNSRRITFESATTVERTSNEANSNLETSPSGSSRTRGEHSNLKSQQQRQMDAKNQQASDQLCCYSNSGAGPASGVIDKQMYHMHMPNCAGCSNRQKERLNDKLKSKVEQLRLGMNELKRRRAARRQRTMPYSSLGTTATVATVTTQSTVTAPPSSSTSASDEVTSNVHAEEVNTVA